MNISKKLKIKEVKAKKIFDSRKNPTVEAKVLTDFGVFFASVPSGASRGKFEAFEIRDKDGKGVKKAIENIEKIITPVLKKENVTNQRKIDEILIRLDGTKNKSKLGANATLPVSIAVCRAAARLKEIPLYSYIGQLAENCSRPSSFSRYQDIFSTIVENMLRIRPCFNIINGGSHTKEGLAIQEFMVVPKEGAFGKNLEAGKKIYQQLREILKKEFGNSGIIMGDEGGFVPPLKTTKEALDFLIAAIEKAGFLDKTGIILDAAATNFFENGKYKIDGDVLNQKELADFYLSFFEKYPIIGIEDPFAEEDWEGWQMLKSKIKNGQVPRKREQKSKILIIGDDLTVTNPERIKLAKKKNVCDAIIVKPNQIGTVIETIEAAKLAKSYGWKLVVSHRSGETMDSFIADLAVGIGADFIKSGAPGPKERMVKYNRLLEIEGEITF